MTAALEHPEIIAGLARRGLVIRLFWELPNGEESFPSWRYQSMLMFGIRPLYTGVGCQAAFRPLATIN